jgi:hypothetical protein
VVIARFGELNGSQEAVTDFWHSLNELWVLDRVFQRLPQLLHSRVDAVLEIDKGFLRPESFP